MDLFAPQPTFITKNEGQNDVATLFSVMEKGLAAIKENAAAKVEYDVTRMLTAAQPMPITIR